MGDIEQPATGGQRQTRSRHRDHDRLRIGTALSLCSVLLIAGCGPRLATKADDAAQRPNPMLNANYTEEAEVPFVTEAKTDMPLSYKQANFRSESASRRTRETADWVVSSSDNLNLPFAIVDKVNAKVYVFSTDGQIKGAAPVLLGMGKGDDVAPGISDMRMSRIPPEDRTTPAGRFQTAMGRNSHGKEILWVDYKNAISMHPVVTSIPKQRRPQRLASPTPLDNRISYGCINVPPEFFTDVIHRFFSGTAGVVYVMPETRSVRASSGIRG
ncbi:L,D-transpeptidase [Thiocystis minor]|uniref:L,D-transpeptidase n=1 Tax=Thiocystis minor TaxID=61597 RepID=UPI00191186DA|nr:L,D-transpeptidase [Thiocystis minor]MBK5962577.1 L,D-transpeptidase [Thiocystis minor]